MRWVQERELTTKRKKPALVARLTEAVKQEDEEIQGKENKERGYLSLLGEVLGFLSYDFFFFCFFLLCIKLQ